MPHRLFVAVDLPDAVRTRLARLVADAPPGVRPVRRGQLHLTLHFLGDCADATLAALAAALPRAAGPAFTIDLAGAGVFPPRGRPAVLWAGVAASDALVGLHRDVGRVLAACGVPLESRPWVPHVTLARLAAHAPRAWIEALVDRARGLRVPDIAVTGLRLYESVRTPAGAEHVPVAGVALDGGPR